MTEEATPKGMWKEQAFLDQLSAERDFPAETPVTFRYAICCGHRTGSNLLGEALYRTGRAGDPMEYLNYRLLQALSEQRGGAPVDHARHIRDMEPRRTSPNGVFGINVKFDQLEYCFQNNWLDAIRLIRDNDFVLFLYRKDKVRQAVSLYIGQSKDMFNVPADVSDEEVLRLVESIPFNAPLIAARLSRILAMEQAWLQFFEANSVAYETLAYEDFVSDYGGTLNRLLGRLAVPEAERVIPEQPMKKISNRVNEDFRSRFLDVVGGGEDPYRRA